MVGALLTRHRRATLQAFRAWPAPIVVTLLALRCYEGFQSFDTARAQVGLKRRGFTKDEIGSLRVAYRQLFAEEGLLSERIEDVAKQFPDLEAVMEIVEFMRADSSRGLTQPRSTNG